MGEGGVSTAYELQDGKSQGDVHHQQQEGQGYLKAWKGSTSYPNRFVPSRLWLSKNRYFCLPSHGVKLLAYSGAEGGGAN